MNLHDFIGPLAPPQGQNWNFKKKATKTPRLTGHESDFLTLLLIGLKMQVKNDCIKARFESVSHV